MDGLGEPLWAFLSSLGSISQLNVKSQPQELQGHFLATSSHGTKPTNYPTCLNLQVTTGLIQMVAAAVMPLKCSATLPMVWLRPVLHQRRSKCLGDPGQEIPSGSALSWVDSR